MSDLLLLSKALLKLACIFGPVFVPWLICVWIYDRKSTLSHQVGAWRNSREVGVSKRPGRPRPTDSINELSEQVMDLQARLRDFQQTLTDMAAQVRQTQQPRQNTEAA